MSVYKRPGSPYFHFDFRRQGRRFYGSTGVETRRAAEAVERGLKEKAARGELGTEADMTLNAAAERWWQEKGKGLRSSKDVDYRLAEAVRLVGKGVMLTEITTARLAKAIEKRRGILIAGRPPSNATVNHAIVRTIRPILRRASKVWEIPGLKVIDWGALLLPEPKPTAREFAAGELDAFKAAAPEHWHAFIDFMAGYGPRLGEMFFPPDDVAEGGVRVTFRRRKAGDDHVMTLLPKDAALMAARVSQARAAGLSTVWFRSGPRGRLVALTYQDAIRELHKALRKSGLKASRGARIHDLRHHAGTAMVRATGNLKLAQKLLGHANIQSTMRYAHASDADLLAGLALVEKSRHSTAAPETTDQQGQEEQGVAAKS